MIIETEDYLSIPEAAKIIGITMQALQRFAQKDAIPNALLFKGRKYYHKDTIRAWKIEYAKISRPRKKQ